MGIQALGGGTPRVFGYRIAGPGLLRNGTLRLPFRQRRHRRTRGASRNRRL